MKFFVTGILDLLLHVMKARSQNRGRVLFIGWKFAN